MIAFRVDANEHIATGHLMRCMAIAKGFQRKGQEVVFFLAEEKETKRLEDQNIPYIVLHSDWRNLEQELSLLEQLLEKYSITKLIVDSYQVTQKYLKSLNQKVKVIYMDDMEEYQYPVAGVIHYSNWPWDKSYEESYKNTDTICMVGMKYTPLREEFYPPVDVKEKKNILLTTGGTDQYNVAGRLLEYALAKRKENVLNMAHFLVVSGSLNQNKPHLEQLAQENDWITLYENVSNMGELMRDSYLAVSAGGTTLYELCACKVPTISFSFADNQEGFTEEMGEQGIMYYAGDARKNTNLIADIYHKLNEMWNHEELCGQYRENMERLVDGKGVERIVEGINAL
ncbi:MAG: UDP-2,4-diacetamido-2,4,6-trideoxy-beta-L-altropyranose hydrolase [Lachnospiraceae bacterium]|nr:UDP-2,4-diacetamido-2,4,6-trideoxy-beta-L-altropyranose hydrolase [Lachnospiraceae bacterium]